MEIWNFSHLNLMKMKKAHNNSIISIATMQYGSYDITGSYESVKIWDINKIDTQISCL